MKDYNFEILGLEIKVQGSGMKRVGVRASGKRVGFQVSGKRVGF